MSVRANRVVSFRNTLTALHSLEHFLCLLCPFIHSCVGDNTIPLVQTLKWKRTRLCVRKWFLSRDDIFSVQFFQCNIWGWMGWGGGWTGSQLAQQILKSLMFVSFPIHSHLRGYLQLDLAHLATSSFGRKEELLAVHQSSSSPFISESRFWEATARRETAFPRLPCMMRSCQWNGGRSTERH